MLGDDRDSRTGRRRAGGFSLAELVLVVMIVGLVALIAVPRYAASEQRYRLELAAKRVIADLDAARQAAKATSTDQRVRFAINGSKYYVSVTRSAAASGQVVGSSAVSEVDLGADPYRVRVVGANLNGYAGIVFDPYGTPSSGGVILLRGGDFAVQIAVDPGTGVATSAVSAWNDVPAPTRTQATSAAALPVDASYVWVKSAIAAQAVAQN